LPLIFFVGITGKVVLIYLEIWNYFLKISVMLGYNILLLKVVLLLVEFSCKVVLLKVELSFEVVPF
jgi:hypothetical protein